MTTPEQAPGAVAEDAGRDVAAISSDDLRELLAKATPGPWITDEIACSVSTAAVNLPTGRTYGHGCGNKFICDLNDGEYHEYADEAEQAANASLIAITPQLAAEVLELRAPSDPVKVAGLDVNLLHRMRTRSSWQDCKAGADALESCHAASAVKDAEIARLTAQAENDAETMRGVRKWVMEGDTSRALLWINDGLSGYTDTAENTLSEAIARAERAEAALAESEASKGALIEKAAKAIDQRGAEEQRNFGLGRETQNFYRARDLVRALDPDATAALAAYVKQHVEAETLACAEVARAHFDDRGRSRSGHHSETDWTDGYDEATRGARSAILARLDAPKGETQA